MISRISPYAYHEDEQHSCANVNNVSIHLFGKELHQNEVDDCYYDRNDAAYNIGVFWVEEYVSFFEFTFL